MKIKKSYRLQWARHQIRWFGKWHVYLGIVAGLIISVVGLTGSILTFQDEIDLALNKNLFEVNQTQRKIPLEDAVPLVKEKYPTLQFDYAMDEADKPNMAYRFYNFGYIPQHTPNPECYFPSLLRFRARRRLYGFQGLSRKPQSEDAASEPI